MSRREKIDKLTDGDVPPTALGLLRALIEASQTQMEALEVLKQRMEAEAQLSSAREAEQAALLDEVRCELAETGAALETEIGKRQAAERATAELEAVVARVWEVLPPQPPAEMRSPCDGAPAPATVDTSTDVAPGAGPVADTGPALGDAAELGEAEDANGLRPASDWSQRPTWLTAPDRMVVAQHARILLRAPPIGPMLLLEGWPGRSWPRRFAAA